MIFRGPAVCIWSPDNWVAKVGGNSGAMAGGNLRIRRGGREGLRGGLARNRRAPVQFRRGSKGRTLRGWGWGLRPVPQAENAPMGKRFPPVAKNLAPAGARKPKSREALLFACTGSALALLWPGGPSPGEPQQVRVRNHGRGQSAPLWALRPQVPSDLSDLVDGSLRLAGQSRAEGLHFTGYRHVRRCGTIAPSRT